MTAAYFFAIITENQLSNCQCTERDVNMKQLKILISSLVFLSISSVALAHKYTGQVTVYNYCYSKLLILGMHPDYKTEPSCKGYSTINTVYSDTTLVFKYLQTNCSYYLLDFGQSIYHLKPNDKVYFCYSPKLGCYATHINDSC